jgi:hypothetical protein
MEGVINLSFIDRQRRGDPNDIAIEATPSNKKTLFFRSLEDLGDK